MRRARVKASGEAFYHIMSRCALQQFLLADENVKEMFMKILHRAEYFSGVKIVNYCIMDNHFHLLVKIPERSDVSDSSLDDRITILYGAKKAGKIFSRWSALNKSGSASIVEKERNAFRKRMFDLSEFMKTFKQRFSLWFCTNHGNIEGTIWQGPFHSVLVEGKHDAIGAISTYITLNPVRAGVVQDASTYAWSSYGAAANGNNGAKAALLSTYESKASTAAKWEAYQAMVENAASKSTQNDDIRCQIQAEGTDNKQKGDGSLKRVDDGDNYEDLHGQSVMLHKENRISRGVAFGSKGFVTVAIRNASPTVKILTHPQVFCIGERRTPLYFAVRHKRMA